MWSFERLRPIPMTTLAMLPLALASDAGSETKNAMAWVIIGRLTSSLIFTLVLVPAVYLERKNQHIPEYAKRTATFGQLIYLYFQVTIVKITPLKFFHEKNVQ